MTNSKVDLFINEAETWQNEIKKLREIILSFNLTEEIKWAKPCYSLGKSNIVLIVLLKESCSLLFCKGALLKDSENILVRPGENSQSSRWMRFTSVQETIDKEAILRAYLAEAIEVEKAGAKVIYKSTEDYAVPKELQDKLDKDPAFKKAFHALTPGRQRGYIIFFSAPKQSKTRESRIESCTPKIFAGKGYNDR